MFSGSCGTGAAPATDAPACPDDPETRETLIRRAACSCFERRDFVDGHELEDWLQAEMQIDRRPAAGARADKSSPAPT